MAWNAFLGYPHEMFCGSVARGLGRIVRASARRRAADGCGLARPGRSDVLTLLVVPWLLYAVGPLGSRTREGRKISPYQYITINKHAPLTPLHSPKQG
jgi:hypothetical protein